MEHFVRFDDLSPGSEKSFVFSDPVDEIVATTAEEVAPALGRLDRLSDAGLWLAGFVSYDAAPGIDPGLRVPGNGAGGLPLVWFGAFERRVNAGPLPSGPPAGSPDRVAWAADVGVDEYEAAIRSIRDAIAAGDTYQVNYTFRLRSAFDGDPLALYAAMARAQSAGYCAYLDVGSHQVVSASPERFFSLDGSQIRVKPMKGTIRRGRWPSEDLELAARLQASDKDRAENLMIVDLLRNDLGRIARFGSVRADRLLDLERYDTVWQLTSEISAELVPESGVADVFGALFPSGSVTGAPKRRTMEIIRALEPSARGIYCGAIGYVAPHRRRAVFNVAIRTAVVDGKTGRVEYGVGGGITWDSTPSGEYDEAMAKADVLRMRARPPGLFETLRWEPGAGYRLIERHLARLEASAGYFGYPWNRASVDQALDAATAGRGSAAVVRLTLSASGAVTVDMRPAPGPFGTPGNPGEGVTVALADERVDSNDILLFHKTTVRDGYERRAAARPDVDDVLLVNERGEVTESTIANVAVDTGTGWVTPPLDSGCLPGTYRAELIESGVLREAVVDIGAVTDRPIALLNSVRGWRPARLAG